MSHEVYQPPYNVKAIFMGIDHRLKGRLLYFQTVIRVDTEDGYYYLKTAYRRQR